MPVDSTFMNEEKYLTPVDYAEIVSELCDHGLEELRLTGGEPLLRKNFVTIVERLSRFPLKKIGLTTNGIFLDRYLETLKANRVHHLNISLDSLKEENFRKITYGNHLKKVLANIELARNLHFHIKLNVVAMRGVNDHELLDFVEFSRATGLEVRFLELMRIGHACADQTDQFIPASELISNLQKNFDLKPVVKESDSTSFNYLLDDGAQIGFIASESKAFCGLCSRWRLSADGILRACLLKNDGISIKNTTKEQREDIYRTLLGMKPFKRPLEVAHHMNAIGG
jgi:cyclic pyranopterin phosphate synthase